MQGCTGSIVSCERSYNGRPRTLRARCPPQLRPRSMASRAFGRRNMGLLERLWSVQGTSTPSLFICADDSPTLSDVTCLNYCWS